MKTFYDLREGDEITNMEDGDMKVMFYDYYGTGKEMCFVSRTPNGKYDGDIYPASQFDPSDWYKVENRITIKVGVAERKQKRMDNEGKH